MTYLQEMYVTEAVTVKRSSYRIRGGVMENGVTVRNGL